MRLKFILYRIYALLLIAVFSGFQSLYAQCAMCRATVENNVSNGDTGLASNLNFGILYLFVTPYLVVGVIAFLWYKKSKRNAQKIKLASYFKRKMPQM